MSKHQVLVRRAEILSVSSGMVGDEPSVFLSLRLDPDASFEVTNLAFSPAQARRLLEDLSLRLSPSTLLRGLEAYPDQAKRVFERIMFGKAVGEPVEANDER